MENDTVKRLYLSYSLLKDGKPRSKLIGIRKHIPLPLLTSKLKLTISLPPSSLGATMKLKKL